MATLYMNTDAVREIIHNLTQQIAEIEKSIQEIDQQIYQLSDAWMGPAANVTIDEFQSFLSQQQALLEYLRLLVQRLSNEVTAWKNTATSLSGESTVDAPPPKAQSDTDKNN